MTLANIAQKKRTLDAAMRALNEWEALACDVGLQLDDLRERIVILQDEYITAAQEFARTEERAA